jgi:hypothetical protein
MSILVLFILLIVIGVGLWLINNKVPMEYWVKVVVNVIAVILVVLLILQAFGLLEVVRQPVPRIR